MNECHYFFPETVDKSLPESISDVIKLKNETLPVREVICNCFQRSGDGGNSEDVQYSMLNQSDTDVFGKENFDNVNFDYDDFNSSDEEISTVRAKTGKDSTEQSNSGTIDQAKSIA